MAYACLWEFIVPPEFREEFAQHYGANGSWVQLFRQSPAYIETLFLADNANPARFVTIDRWHSEADYEAFRTRFAVEYARMDTQFARLTDTETFMGAFAETEIVAP
jgi:heme-degrading monooxygenase HmoA